MLSRSNEATVKQATFNQISCVVKEYKPEHESSYEREKKVLLQCAGKPGIPILYTYNDRKLQLFIEMGMCDLEEWLAGLSEKLNTETVIDIGECLMKSVESLHSSKWSHRDIKTSNIIVLKSKPMKLAFCDFGSAAPLGGVKVSIEGSLRIRPPWLPSTGKEYVTNLLDFYAVGKIMARLLEISDRFEESDKMLLNIIDNLVQGYENCEYYLKKFSECRKVLEEEVQSYTERIENWNKNSKSITEAIQKINNSILESGNNQEFIQKLPDFYDILGAITNWSEISNFVQAEDWLETYRKDFTDNKYFDQFKEHWIVIEEGISKLASD